MKASLANLFFRVVMGGRRLIRTITGKKRITLAPGFELREFSNVGCETFFGYYDVTPFSVDDELLLALCLPQGEEGSSFNGWIDVGFFHLNQSRQNFQKVGETSSWCWQQGCRLQWYPSTDTEKRIILYNCIVDGAHGAVLQDLDSKRFLKKYKRAIYSLSPDGQFGISLNFSRLQRCRPGYGYIDQPDLTKHIRAPEDDGLWRVDMLSGEVELVLSVSVIANLSPHSSMLGAEHYFNHVLWNPDSSRFLFLHLWVQSEKRRSRLITADRNGEDLCTLYNEDHMSHHCWLTPHEILAYSTHQESGTRFHIYKDGVGMTNILGKDILELDGHPSRRPGGSQILVDTYPDKKFEQEIFTYIPGNLEKKIIGRFFNPARFEGEFRCDLHPRWSSSGKMISLDSGASGKRKMYVIGEQVK